MLLQKYFILLLFFSSVLKKLSFIGATIWACHTVWFCKQGETARSANSWE